MSSTHARSWSATIVLLLGGLFLSAFAYPPNVPGETFMVSNTSSSGSGSLHQAILDANANPGGDRIEFNIPGQPEPEGRYVIRVEELLPPITDPVIIDGTSQAGAGPAGDPAVEITGIRLQKSCAGVESGLYRDFPGLDVVNNSQGDASGTTIQGLKISHFCQAIAITASFDELQQPCLGATDSGLRISNITVQDNLVEDNLDGNGAIDLCFTEQSTIRGNRLLRNGDHLEITRSQHVVIAGNVGADAQDALELVQSRYITVENNRFSHTSRNGIVSVFEASDNRILSNVVSDVAAMGIVLANNNQARGNTVTQAGWFGIAIRGGSNNIVSENIVTDNALGGIAVSAGTFLFLAECSTDPGGRPFDCGVSFPLVNLSVEGDAFDNVIRDNEVAFNRGPGIVVGGSFVDTNGNERRAARNKLAGNIIYANEGLGIDLSDQTQSLFFAAEEPLLGAFGEIVLVKGDGVTPNNAAMLSNEGQDFPVLTAARATPGRLVVTGTVDTRDPHLVTIQLFANAAPTPGGDPSGYGEGAIFLGKAKPNRHGKFTIPLPPVPAGTLITATATDADGNTSELAANIEARFRP